MNGKSINFDDKKINKSNFYKNNESDNEESNYEFVNDKFES